MPEFPKLPIISPPPRPDQRFPDLPILEPDPPRMSLREKYGGLYYFGIGGLIFATFLIGRFFVGLYQTRALWIAVFSLANPNEALPDRMQAAWTIAHDPSGGDAQKMNFALNSALPDLARYILAEGLSPEAIQADPKGYALMASRSEPWPDWLRLMVARPMAYAVGEGYRIPWEPLDELRGRSDQAIRLWMTYTRAVMGPGEVAIADQLRDLATKPGAYQPLAQLLSEAQGSSGLDRIVKLDAATRWLHTNHPPCAKVWDGWEVQGAELVAKRPLVSGPTPTPSPPAPLSDEHTAPPR